MNAENFSPTERLGEDLLLRPADFPDLDPIMDVEQLSQPAPWTRRVFEKELELEFSRTWVVSSQSTDLPPVCAFLVFWLVHDEIHILNICVHPEVRRRGIARQLIERLAELGEEQRASIISLEVRASNAAAKELYGSMGFVPIGTRPKYYADNHEDADILVLLLEE